MLDLRFSPEQEMLRETVRGVCASTSPLPVVRQLEDDPIGFSPDLWKQLAHLDLIGLQVPEEFGGSGMTAVEGVVLYEELGRALAPSPHFVSAVLCGDALVQAGDDGQQQEWLPGIVSGEAILTPAWLEPDNGFGPRACSTGRAHGDGFALSGVKRHVAFAKAASRLLVLARTGDAPTDIDLFLVDPAAPGVTLTQQMTIASDCQYRVDLDRVQVGAADRVGGAETGWSTWDAVMHDGIILAAAQAVGRGQVRVGDHRAVRQGPPPVRQAARGVPGAGPLPGRCLHRRRRGRAARPRGGLGPLGRSERGQAGADGQAVRLSYLPRRDGHGPAGVRGHRVHRRVRHPAVFPSGQGAPDLVVGHPLPRGAGGRGGDLDVAGRPSSQTAYGSLAAHDRLPSTTGDSD